MRNKNTYLGDKFLDFHEVDVIALLYTTELSFYLHEVVGTLINAVLL